MQERDLHVEDERPLSREALIEVLVEAIYAAGSTVPPSVVVASRLNARGVWVTVRQVEAVYGQYDLDVKIILPRISRDLTRLPPQLCPLKTRNSSAATR